jgi:uncharacterized protein YchJ
MTTDSQIAANRKNALASAGPTTETGKAASSRNALTMGLYTRADYVRPEERDLYKEFCETLYTELCPEGLLEQTFVAEVTGAAWRLRRCSAVEAGLADYAMDDPMLDESTEKARRSIDRARSHAHSLLHRSVNQLRRLQTERACRLVLNAVGDDAGLADYKHVLIASNSHARAQNKAFDNALGSNCKPASATPQTPRSAPCPCHSGEKYKRCCGKNAPPMLFNKAA